MPIPPDQFNNNPNQPASRILEILESQPYQAYTFQELIPQSDNVFLESIYYLETSFQIERLVNEGHVVWKRIDGVTYFLSAKALA